MLGTIIIITLITFIVVAPVVALAVCKGTKEFDDDVEKLGHPERIRLKGE
jgi:hypothetical protein